MEVNITNFSNVIASINGIAAIITLLLSKLFYKKGIKNIRSIEYISNIHKLCVFALVPFIILLKLHIFPMLNEYLDFNIQFNIKIISIDTIRFVLIIIFNLAISIIILFGQASYLEYKIKKIKKFIKNRNDWGILNNGKSNVIYNIMLFDFLFIFFIVYWLKVFQVVDENFLNSFIDKSMICWGVYTLYLYIKFIIGFKLPMLIPKKILQCEYTKYNCISNLVLEDCCYVKDNEKIVFICSNESNFTMMLKKENIKEYRVEYRIFIPLKIKEAIKNDIDSLFLKIKSLMKR